MKYTEKYRVKWHDTDASRRVRPSELLVYMQETANLQFVSHGRDLDAKRDEDGYAFILSKMCVDIHAPLHAYEEIEVETFTCESRGFSFNRCFRILRGGEVIAEALSVWALINIRDAKLIRAEVYDVGFENEPILCPAAPLRIKMPPADSFSECGKRRIVYSDIDYNMHMNNTHYPDMLCDHLSEMIDGDAAYTVGAMSLSYIKESHLGATLTVTRGEMREDGGIDMRTLNENGEACLEAVVKLIKI